MENMKPESGENAPEEPAVIVEDLKGAEQYFASTVQTQAEKYLIEAKEMYPDDEVEQKEMVTEYTDAYCTSTDESFTLASETTIIDYERKKAIAEAVLADLF